MNLPPILLRYQGEGAFKSISARTSDILDRELVIGEQYRFEIVEERSLKSHRAYFAALAEAWKSLPERLTDDFLSPDHLRKWALVKAGYCTTTKLTLRTNAEAIAAAALVGEMDSYAICEVIGRLVTIWRAESQSYRAMKKERFQQSKDDCLRVIAELIGTDPVTLQRAEAA